MINNKIVIFGASGFIGNHLYNFLKKNNYEVLFISRKSIKSDFVDYLNFNNLKNFPNKYHNAFCAINLMHDYKSNKQNEKLINTVINCIKKNNINNLIYFSSTKVYKMIEGKNKYNINSELDLNSDYSNSKIKSETLIAELSEDRTFNFIILRIPHVIGRNGNLNFRILLFLIKYNIPLPIRNLDSKKNFVGIKLINLFILSIIKNNFFENKIYIICNQQLFSVKDIATFMAKKYNKRLITFVIPRFFINIMSLFVKKIEILKFYQQEQIFDVQYPHFFNKEIKTLNLSDDLKEL